MSEETEKKILEVLSKIEQHLSKEVAVSLDRELFDPEESAAILNCSRTHFYKVKKQYGLKGRNLSGKIVYHKDDLRALANKLKEEPVVKVKKSDKRGVEITVDKNKVS